MVGGRSQRGARGPSGRGTALRSLGLCLAAALLVAAPADASSITYVKDNNIFLVTPEGEDVYQVTAIGSRSDPFSYATQADDGTIVAVRDAVDNPRIFRLTQGGVVRNLLRVPSSTLGPITPKVSPDGKWVVFWSFAGNEAPSCVYCADAKASVSILPAAGGSAVAPVSAIDGYRHASWISSDRLLLFKGTSAYVQDLAGGRPALWWSDLAAAPSLSAPGAQALGPGDVAAGRVTVVRGAAQDTLQVYETALGTEARPAPVCTIGAPEGAFAGATFSPNGKSMAWQETNGIWVSSTPTPPDCSPPDARLLIPGGTAPDWGPAEIEPATRQRGPTRDTERPALTKLSIERHNFRAARSGRAAGGHGVPLRYDLSEAARVKFTVVRLESGRLVGERCLRVKRGPRCDRLIDVGSFTHTGHQGENLLAVTGRMRGRALRRGTYLLIAEATDDAKNRSSLKRTFFRIIG